MHVGMMGQRRSPGVQHQGHANLRAEVLRVGSKRAQGLGGDLKQQAVDDILVALGEGADRRRQGEHYVEIAHRREVGLAAIKPAPRRR